MRLLDFLRPAPRPVPPVAPANPAAYPWTSFPRGRRPTEAEIAAIMARRTPTGPLAGG